MNTKRRLLFILVIIFVLLFALIVISIAMNQLYYYPLRETSDVNALNVVTQVLSPYTQATAQFKDFYTPHIFSYYKLNLSFQKIMNENGYNDNVSKRYSIRFFLGNIVDIESETKPNDQPLTLIQQDFFSVNNISTREIDDNSYYEALFGFNTPILFDEVIKKYNNIDIETSIDNKYQYGIIWYAIKSSNQLSAHCIGVSGQFSAYYFLTDDNYPGIKNVSGDDVSLYKSLLFNSLEYLIENQDEASIYLQSGLFGEKFDIDFQERYDYLQNNSIECIGFTIYLDGANLKKLCNSELILLKVYKKQLHIS